MLAGLIILVIALICAIAVAVSKNLMRAALAFVCMSVLIGLFYIVLALELVGIVQIAVYSTGVSAIILYILSITKGGESE